MDLLHDAALTATGDIMNRSIKTIAASLLLGAGLATFATSTVAALPADFDAKLAARPDADKARDAARKPKESVQELGLQEGMTVVDVAAGGGWFTRVLSAAVGPKGKVIAQFGQNGLRNNNGQAQRDMAKELGNVEPFFDAVTAIPANSADAAVTAMNLHDAYNGSEEAGLTFIKNIFNVLKPGGVAAIIDHAGNEGADNRTLHRMTPASAKALIEKAGFQIVKESKVLANPQDDRTKAIRDGSLGRATDQFFFVVRKPK
jgi:predicted methyltransferase